MIYYQEVHYSLPGRLSQKVFACNNNTIPEDKGIKIIGTKVLNLRDKSCNFLQEYRPPPAIAGGKQVPAGLPDISND
jgi:hypothetical protein